MQSLYNYTRYFKPSQVYTKEFIPKFYNNFNTFHLYLCHHPIVKTPYAWQSLALPNQKHFQPRYYPLLRVVARYCGVKLMWYKLFSSNLSHNYKSVLIIGEQTRIGLCSHIIEHLITGLEEVKKHIIKTKEPSPCRTRAFAKECILEWVGRITQRIGALARVVTDMDRTYKLEKHVMSQYKLDFKKYHTKIPTYHQAISRNIFKERRMLL